MNWFEVVFMYSFMIASSPLPSPSNFDEIDIPSLNDDMMNGQNYNLNLYIQKDEIIKCIQKLKNNKAGVKMLS
jgi:hypothetical protein